MWISKSIYICCNFVTQCLSINIKYIKNREVTSFTSKKYSNSLINYNNINLVLYCYKSFIKKFKISKILYV